MAEERVETAGEVAGGPRRTWLNVVRPAGRDPLRVVILSPGFRAWHTHWDPERGRGGGTAPHVAAGCYHCSLGRAVKMDGFVHCMRQGSGDEALVHLTLHAMADLLTLTHPEHGLRGLGVTLQRTENRSNGRVRVHTVYRRDVATLPPAIDFRPDVARLLGVPSNFPLSEVLCILDDTEGGGQ